MKRPALDYYAPDRKPPSIFTGDIWLAVLSLIGAVFFIVAVKWLDL
jgi:hypothetical protein